MKDTTSAGSGVRALASPPEDGAPARAAAGRAVPAPGPGRGGAGERIWVQMASPAARKTVSTAAPVVVTCQRRAALGAELGSRERLRPALGAEADRHWRRARY